MLQPIQKIININFCLKCVEFIACGIGAIYIDISYVWCVFGRFLISIALVFAYRFEQPNFGLELTLLLIYLFPMSNALWELSDKNLPPAIISIIMFAELICLVITRDQE